jgi:hypothetical protein
VSFHFTAAARGPGDAGGDAKHLMLFGGSRSGKTFLLVRNVVMRGLKAPNSRHAIFRYRFNAVKASVVSDTFPKVMRLAFPGSATASTRPTGSRRCRTALRSGSAAWTTRSAPRRSGDGVRDPLPERVLADPL